MYIGMSETIPSSRSGEPWAQFYQHSNISGQATPPAGAGRTLFGGGGDSDTTTMVAAASATTNVSSSSSGPHHGSAASAQLLNPDGRVSKPVRRRSRASRRTPTTLLNTDTSNFRAMVQQFTGGPTVPAASHHPTPPPANFNFGLGISRQQLVNPSTAVVMVPNSDLYHRLPLHIQQQQQQQQQLFQHHRGHGDVNFLQRLAHPNSSRPTGAMDGAAAAGGGFASPPPPPPPPSSNENNSSINYMF